MPVSCYKLSLLKNDAEETFKILQVSDAIIIGELCGSKKLEKRKRMRWPGIEPGSAAWKAAMLTFTPPTPPYTLPSTTFAIPPVVMSLSISREATRSCCPCRRRTHQEATSSPTVSLSPSLVCATTDSADSCPPKLVRNQLSFEPLPAELSW